MKRIIISIFTIAVAMVSFAQDIIVTVTPRQQILPPQVLMYLANPDQYFNVSLMNTTSEAKNVYLAMNLDQVMPNSSISVHVGAAQQPERPFVIPANGAYQLTMVDMRKLFDHVPSSEVQATPGLFDSYLYGSFGLLPEGEYQAQMIAYQWNPALRTPVAVSNLNGGKCTFTICYKAQAPQFLTPMVSNIYELNEVAELDPLTPQFTWTAPIVSCNPLANNFQYRLKIVEMLPTQTVTEAIERNAAVYYSPTPVISPLTILPQTVANKLDPKVTYVAQVEASLSNLQSTYLNYAMIENDGKSAYRLFKVKKVEKAEPDQPEEPEEPIEPEVPADSLDVKLKGRYRWEVDSTKLYTFRNPEIVSPQFNVDEKRRTFTFEDIPVKFNAAWYVGGMGDRPDTLDLSYTLNLYKADRLIETYEEIEEHCRNNEPVYHKELKVVSDTIEYPDIVDAVNAGDYLYLRIDPVCKNEESIAWVDSLCNKKNWALIDRPTKEYFQCSNSVTIEDYEPTTKKASDLKGTVVMMGEYKLRLDEIEDVKGKTGRFKGKGHIEWRPLGYKVMVNVQFDSIGINQDGIVFAGEAYTYERNEEMKSNSECVKEIFSDIGIDDWASDLGMPYGDTVDQYTMDEANKIADKVDISQYYSYLKKGKGAWDDLMQGEIDDLYFPVKVPSSVNSSPVDLQLFSATFAPQWAKVNVIGEFTLPESEYTKDNILLLAAPRLCIDPDNLLPESGTIALMKDFTVTDPDSQFELTFKAPDDLQVPTMGCFVSWKDYKLELFDIDVSMLIPNVKKVDEKGKKIEEQPKINLHASIGAWEDWYAEGYMDNFMSEDLDGWIFMPGKIIYDHSTVRSAPEFEGLPSGYDRVKAGMKSSKSPDFEWKGLFISDMGVVFPKMLKVDDQEKNWEGHLKLMAKKIILDASGLTLDFGMTNVFDLATGKAGGWGISMEEIMLNVTQNKFTKCWFKGEIETPLEGTIGYRCDMYAQGQEEGRAPGDEGFAYVFTTQQIEGLKFDFWLAEFDFKKDQTYFLLEAETYSNSSKEDEVRVELCLGGDLTISIGRDWLKSKGLVGNILNAYIPGLHISGMRIANCQRWKSKYFKNIYDISQLPDVKEGDKLLNETFGFKEEYNCGSTEEKGNFYFSMGRWSLSSPEKTIGPFKFALGDCKLKPSGTKVELQLEGKIGICDVLEANCGIAIVSNVDLNKFSFSFGGVEFRKISFETGFGGCTVKGSMEVATGDDEGYSGELEIDLPGGLFELRATGGFYKAVDTDSTKYSWGYLLAELKSSVGIRIDPIVITGVKGGFYFNCRPEEPKKKATETKAVRSRGCVGFMLGMCIATSAGEETLSADMDLTVVYDTRKKKLSTMIMNGSLKAVGGLLKASAQIVYKDDDESRYFNICLTANGEGKLDADLKETFSNFAGYVMEDPIDIPANLDDLTAEEQKTETTQKSGSNASEGDKGKFVAKTGVSISIDFRIEHFKSGDNAGKTKWHLYIGKPPYDERCSNTLIDFQAGKKSDRFAVWAYLGSKMYFCLGNELPNGGALPDLPQKARDFLDGNDVNGDSQNGNADKAMSRSASQVQSMLATVNKAGCEGGIMAGAVAEGDFGVNAGIVYAHAYACLGFDIMLKKLSPGTECRGGGSLGYKNWYGMGQAYVVLLGDLGVHIDLWFIKKDIPIVEVGVGALLQAGLPNPTWCYGKCRARLSLLGGIFKFNRSIEFKAGRVCLPDYGDPLDNIEIVAEVQPGNPDRAQANEEVASVYSMPRFTTNFVIGKEVMLVDQNKQTDIVMQYDVDEETATTMAERRYRFVINSVKVSKVGGTPQNCNWKLTDDEGINFDIDCAEFEPETEYYIEITSEAQEYDKKLGKFSYPIIDGKSTPKVEVKKVYFKTGKLSEDIKDEIAYALPKQGTWDIVRADDLIFPYICLKHHRTDLVPEAGIDRDTDTNSEAEVKFGYRWVLYKNGKRYKESPNYVDRSENYETWYPAYGFNVSDYGSTKYKLSLVRYVKGAKKANTINTGKLVSVKKSKLEKTNGTYTASNRSMSGTTNYALQMKRFFANEEAENALDRSVETTTTARYVDKVAIRDSEKEMFSVTANSLVANETFATSKSVYPYEDVYMALAEVNCSNLGDWLEMPSYYIKNSIKGWQKNPYLLMLYYCNHVFLGGQEFGEYAFSDLKHDVSGLSIDLQYKKFRQSEQYGLINGVLKDFDSDDLFSYYKNYVPFLDSYGQGGIITMGTPHYFTCQDYKMTSTLNYEETFGYQPLHVKMLEAYVSDAMGMETMLAKIRADVYQVASLILYLRQKISGDKAFKYNVKLYSDDVYFNTMTACSEGSCTVVMRSTDLSRNNHISAPTFSYSVPYKQYFQMENMTNNWVSKVKKIHNVTNLETNFKFRYDMSTVAWNDIFSPIPFSAKEFLTSIKNFKYVMYRATVYNINTREIQKWDFSKNQSGTRYYIFEKPFDKYDFNY